MSRTTGRPLDWQAGGSPQFSTMDDAERWKGAQLRDAKNGIFWGKYGKAEKARLSELEPSVNAALEEVNRA